MNDSSASTKDNVSIASAQSISNASSEGEEDERLVAVALKYVVLYGFVVYFLLAACVQVLPTYVLLFPHISSSLIRSPY
jgi:hypothetical protein